MLTKSGYIRYLQCEKYLWLYKNRQDLIPTEVDLEKAAIISAGYEVENYAYKLYPNGVSAFDLDPVVNPENILSFDQDPDSSHVSHISPKTFEKARLKTKELIEKKTPVIFQPTFFSKDLFCRSDIIEYDKKNDAWDIIEIKSTTQVKDLHYSDLAFQKICLEDSGVKVGRIYLMHINNEYVKDGEIDPSELLDCTDITRDVERIIESVKIEIKSALKVLKMKFVSDVRILRQCKKPYKCDFIQHCWKDIPEKSIYSIAGALGEKRLNLLLNEGIMDVADIPVGIMTSKKLQRHYCVVKNNIVHIEKDKIREEIEKIKYPIYYLDYETYAPVVPTMDGYRPYQKIVFQYSLHVQEEKGGELKHYSFLAKGLDDPTEQMAESLLKVISQKGSVIAWNMTFEQGCNREMGERAGKYSEFFEDINERMYDLMQIFRKGYYVHKDFDGSAKLKKVLPVIVPELSYKGLGIQEGMIASNSWGEAVKPGTSRKERDKIYKDLLDYCELDTLAMVKILEKLSKL